MQRFYRFLAWFVVVVGILVGVLRATAIRWWQVPTNDPELAASLAPTLRAGDWVLLWRLTPSGLGDLVLCPDPDDATNVVVGRIVGESSAKITIHGQSVRVDDKELDIEYNCTERTFSIENPDNGQEEELNCDMENVGGVLHMRGYNNDRRQRAAFNKQVEPGRVFLVSDNRVHPFDSRHYGTLDRRTCTEMVFFRLVSKDGFFDVPNRLTKIR